MPDTISAHSDGEDPIPNEDTWIGSKTYNIKSIESWYEEEMFEGPDLAKAFRRLDLITEWYKWCDVKHPGTTSQDWKGKAAEDGEDVDIRVLIRSHPIAGYAVFKFLEACYAVDEALCGTDTEAFAIVKVWHMPQEMRAYRYLLSKDMRRWWTTELEELENEIKSLSLNLVSLSGRMMDLDRGLVRLENILQDGKGILTNIWSTMEGDGVDPLSAGIEDGILDRVGRLKTSLNALHKALERRKQGDVLLDTPPTVSHRSVESTGIRRRIPRAASSISRNNHRGIEARTDTIESGTITAERSPDVLPSILINFLRATSFALGTRYFQLIFMFAINHLKKSRARYKTIGLLQFFFHKETAIVVSICFIVGSGSFMAISVALAKSQPTALCGALDPIFLGNLSQSILSNLSIYLIIATTIHSQSIGLRYQFWFWVCLIGSIFSSMLGLSLYCARPLASIVFLWAAAFAQVVIPILLIVKARESETVNRDDVENHRD